MTFSRLALFKFVGYAPVIFTSALTGSKVDKVLDVGAGTGFLTVELAQRCGPAAQVIAVDPWKAAMDRLRRKCDYLGLDNVVLLEQDAAALDLPEKSVDLIVSKAKVKEKKVSKDELMKEDDLPAGYEE